MAPGRLFALFAALCGAWAGGCARPYVRPPVKPVPLTNDYLLPRTSEVVGDVLHVRDGLWCSTDGAFSLPVVPFPNGPTAIVDDYRSSDITARLGMYDADESIVHVVRTRIRPGLREDEVLDRVAPELGAVEPVRAGWIRQSGVVQIEEVNPQPDYDGRSDALMFAYSQAVSWGADDSCRVDRHFVGAGYYFQVVAVAHKPKHRLTPCQIAAEMASWTVANMRVGKGCAAPDAPPPAS